MLAQQRKTTEGCMKGLKASCVLLALGAVACQESGGPTGETFARAADFTAAVDAATGEEVTICKEGNTGAQSFTINVSSNGTFGGANDFFGLQSLVSGECKTVVIEGGLLQDVTVEEVNIPAGYQLDKVVVFPFAGNLGGVQPPIDPSTNPVTVQVGGNPSPTGAVVVFYNSVIPGMQGCTPGYWKNHTNNWVGYATGAAISSVFNTAVNAAYASLGSKTLLQGLSLQGGSTLSGGAEILFRAAIAALLNASNPNVAYPLTTAQIIADVNAALATGDRAALIALATTLDGYNNLGCPIGR
jgi:hypothetical protein